MDQKEYRIEKVLKKQRNKETQTRDGYTEKDRKTLKTVEEREKETETNIDREMRRFRETGVKDSE